MTVKVGLIGYGYAGKTFHAPLIAATPGLALSAVATTRADAVSSRWTAVDIESTPAALIARSDLDLIVIATPNDTHAPLASAALEAGKHVVVDKPFALDLAQARTLVAAAERCDRQLCVFHNRRWDSDFLSVRAAIADGVVGAVRHFESHFDRFRPQVRDRWREQAGPGAGVWYDLGPHLIDQALVLFGLPDAVQADLAVQRTEAKVDDWAHVILRYADRRVILHADMLAADGGARFVVRGEEGGLVKRRPDQQEAQLLAGMTPGEAGWGDDADDLMVFDGAGRETRRPATPGDQRGFYAAVAAAIRGEAAGPVPPIQALAVMAVLEAAITAARAGATARLGLTADERAAFAALA